MKKYIHLIIIIPFIFSCKKSSDTLFEELPSSVTGIDFVNRSLERKDFNIFNYRNFYNGGGVAIGDINNDGLSDIFVTSNFEENRLYLNKGNMQFEDITQKAGIIGKKFWSTGATFADVNGDGAMDIYVCNSGSRDARGNQLYINQAGLKKGGIPVFEESASQYGLADGGFSTHAAFFDYDRDGDLDMYLLNNSFTPIDKLGYQNIRNQRDKLGGDKLFRNTSTTLSKGSPLTPGGGTHFEDVSEEAGIYGSLIGFGLGITIGDVNEDNWPDIYISNDFYERDYLYINQRNGTFKEDIKSQMQHISLSSMGADIADINNDGLLDIFVTDMLPGDDVRLKTTSTFEGFDLFDFKLKQDFWYQYMRNNLHLNNGEGGFSEIGQFSGVHATDWSWGALIFDMDNDGYKDLFVANGILKDLTDQDFVNFLGDRNTMQQMLEGKKFDAKEFIDKISSKPIPNYAFKNQGNLKFENQAKLWGLEGPGFSNGSAYGDLDNDGDLDLIVNNLNAPLSVYKNKSVENNKTNFLRVNLIGTQQNIHGIGSKIYVYQDGELKMQQQMPNRGFQSSSDHQLIFGLGTNSKIDSVKIIWPNDATQVLKNVQSNGNLVLNIKDANQKFVYVNSLQSTYFQDNTNNTISYTHTESNFVDYNRDLLLKQKLSTTGPAMAVGDVNADGLDDIYLGGAAGQKKVLYIQSVSGQFKESNQADFALDQTTENTDAVFFDADNDKDLDLFVVTGSNEFEQNAVELHDLLYLNDGKGNLKRDIRFPSIYENGSSVAASDFDKDGDIDLFVGSRMISGKYGLNAPSNLFINDGTGGFKNMTKRYMPQISELGMVTDAEWADIDKDGFQDLVVTQDWGGIAIYKNEKGGQLVYFQAIENSEGLWNCLKPMDIDGDGDIDFIAGNAGENIRMKASVEKPAYLYTSDFDKNGAYEQIITCETENGISYPMIQKPDLQRAIPSIKTKFIKYIDFAGKTIDQIFTEEELKEAVIKKVTTLQTSFLINDGKGNFTLKPLPAEVQFSTVNGIEPLDYDGDGFLDLVLTGNFYDILPEWGRCDANFGIVMKGLSKGNYKIQKNSKTGFKTLGQVRKTALVKRKNGLSIVLAKNNESAQIFEISKSR
ncbi:MAG: VCBS repeat-containing protein [Bacteroidota bacterium]